VSASDDRRARSLPSIAELFAPADRSQSKGDVAKILAARPILAHALGERPSLFSATEPADMPARDLMARQLAELVGENGDAVVAALADDSNAAARMLDKLLSGLAAPKGSHRGKVGRPSSAAEHFAAWVLGSALKAQGHSQAEVQRRLVIALGRIGVKLRPAGASAAYHKGRKRFGRR
jgi:hypothetical protein